MEVQCWKNNTKLNGVRRAIPSLVEERPCLVEKYLPMIESSPTPSHWGSISSAPSSVKSSWQHGYFIFSVRFCSRFCSWASPRHKPDTTRLHLTLRSTNSNPAVSRRLLPKRRCSRSPSSKLRQKPPPIPAPVPVPPKRVRPACKPNPAENPDVLSGF